MCWGAAGGKLVNGVSTTTQTYKVGFVANGRASTIKAGDTIEATVRIMGDPKVSIIAGKRFVIESIDRVDNKLMIATKDVIVTSAFVDLVTFFKKYSFESPLTSGFLKTVS